MKNCIRSNGPKLLIISAMLFLPLSLLAAPPAPVAPRPAALPKPPVVAPKPPTVAPKTSVPSSVTTKPATGHSDGKPPAATAPKAAPPASSHSTGPVTSPNSGGSHATVDYETIKKMLENDPVIEKLLKQEKIDIETDAWKGLMKEHELFAQFVGLGEPTHAKSGKFELALAEKLVGKDKLKKLAKEDIEDLQALTCSSKCGHPKFNLSCRRITRFLAVAGTSGLTGAALSSAFHNFMKAESFDGGKSIETSSDNGQSIKVDKLDDLNAVPEEQVSKTEESKQ